ncbi:MAG: cupin domain-containing protein [Verrucomicrobiae bacterium]|nr:cupin domain-containing protein [Verrucomicrobiae bacterium]MCP5541294.1 cupin domain-containing protein [Akkermansiaceae bacterium]MCP5550959.1 cupin domain-containing protein [Akkermansiaceae bacterium]
MAEATLEARFAMARFDEIPAVPCPCGESKRAFMDEPEGVASMHLVTIKADSRTHYHKRMTEIYYVLEGEGALELDGDSFPVRPGTAVMIKPGCRHRAVGEGLKILNVPVPKFDPDDEWFDE